MHQILLIHITEYSPNWLTITDLTCPTWPLQVLPGRTDLPLYVLPARPYYCMSYLTELTDHCMSYLTNLPEMTDHRMSYLPDLTIACLTWPNWPTIACLTWPTWPLHVLLTDLTDLTVEGLTWPTIAGPARPRNDKDDPNRNDVGIFDWLAKRNPFQSILWCIERSLLPLFQCLNCSFRFATTVTW